MHVTEKFLCISTGLQLSTMQLNIQHFGNKIQTVFSVEHFDLFHNTAHYIKYSCDKIFTKENSLRCAKCTFLYK